MKQNYLTLPDDTNDVLRGCFHAIMMSAPFILMVLFTWLGVQRAEILYERNWRINLGRQLELERSDWNSTLAISDQRLSKAEAALSDAEAKASSALDAKTRAEARYAQEEQELSVIRAGHSAPVNGAPVQSAQQSPPVATPAADTEPPPAAPTVPSAADITEFVRAHLGRMAAGPVNGELADYADQVDFHDRPYASLQDIATDRERWAQRWPRRLIFKDEVMPEVVFNRDPYFGVVATVEFSWRWVFWSRSNAMIQGVYRDTWRIVPGVRGLKIISEHSVDSATGRSRD